MMLRRRWAGRLFRNRATLEGQARPAMSDSRFRFADSRDGWLAASVNPAPVERKRS
jgi:hypothetical protein